MTLQSFLSVDALLTALVALVFGLIVISQNRKNIINQTGFLLTLATALWSFAYWRWLSIYIIAMGKRRCFGGSLY